MKSTNTISNAIYRSFLAKMAIAWIIGLFSLGLWAQETEKGEILELDSKKFVQELVKNNFEYRLSSFDEKTKIAIYHENKGQNYLSPLNFSYQQNSNQIEGRSNQLLFGVDWSHTFIKSGTKIGLGLNNRQTRITPDPSKVTAADSWQSTVSLLNVEQPFLRGGFVNNYNNRILDIDRFAVKTSRADFNTATLNIIYKALSDYYLYQINLESLRTLELDLSDARETLAFNRRKARLGTIDEKDLLSSEVITIQIELQLENLKEQLESLKNELLGLIGKTSQNYADIKIQENDSDAVDETSESISITEAYAIALENREDYKKIFIQQMAAENALKVGKTARFPELNATFGLDLIGKGASIGDSYNDLDFSFKKMDIRWGLKFLLFTDYKWYSYSIERANVQIQQAKVLLDQAKLNIYKDVEGSILNIQNSLKQLNSQIRIRDLIRRKYDLSKKDYFNGRIDFSNNITTKKELQAAELNYLTQKLNHQQALLQYQWTTGILLKQFNVEILDANADVPN